MKLTPVQSGTDLYPQNYSDKYSAGIVPSDGRLYWTAISDDGGSVGYGLGADEAIGFLIMALEREVKALKGKK